MGDSDFEELVDQRNQGSGEVVEGVLLSRLSQYRYVQPVYDAQCMEAQRASAQLGQVDWIGTVNFFNCCLPSGAKKSMMVETQSGPQVQDQIGRLIVEHSEGRFELHKRLNIVCSSNSGE